MDVRNENNFDSVGTTTCTSAVKRHDEVLDLDSDDDSPDSSVSTNEAQTRDRGLWANKLEFFLAITGYTVGLGSVWRFPMVCSRNGGGAFLIPFFFFLITSGGPLYYLEVCLGQFTGLSAGLAYEFCPLLKGLGILQVLLSLTVLWYLMDVLAWTFYFLYSCFQSELPWTTCNNSWNTHRCRAVSEVWSSVDLHNSSFQGETVVKDVYSGMLNGSASIISNVTMGNTNVTSYNSSGTSTSAYEFWEYKVIARSSGLEDMGSIQIHLVVSFFLAWVFCVAAVIKGVKSLGKVVYITATAPYVFLTIIFIKGLMLDGALDGMETFLKPDFSKLLTYQVWVDAAVQVFFSLGPSWGTVITMSSYNRFHDKSFWSTTLCVCSAGFTSFYNGLVVFTLLGFMAKTTGIPLHVVASQSGPGLVFVVFPTVLSQMPVPHLWSVLFFAMLITVAFDSLFGMFETVTSAVIDLFPHQLIRHRSAINIIGGLIFFICELPLTMNGGIYLMQLADWYFSAFAVLFSSFFQLLAVCWLYGTDRFARDIHYMTGRDVCVLLRIMWTIVIPSFVSVIFFIFLLQYSAPSYGDGYVYSSGAIAAGIFMGLVPIIVMVGVGIFTFIRLKGSCLQRLKTGCSPSEKWCPHDHETKDIYLKESYVYPATKWKTFCLNIRGSDKNTFF
ncbi:sodium- and chloride-dependent betaine transporter-like [Ruditapes philippinarum]|uniref:sodium- and chloride-dependent betaine transporter-like n=1 Tax=Ruditapes philippinarum TaxID=129788 RepID=UPI00295B58B9|nr:sodium- and chloride-dependent betaine transporter-like [Ruditapes philippinarum]